MCDCFRICINKIPFFCQPYLFQIIAPKTFYFRHAAFPPAYRNIKGLYFPVSMNKCQRTYIPIHVYAKHGNHCIPSGNISRIEILHFLIVFHIHVIRNTHKSLFAQPLHYFFPLLIRKTLNAGILCFRIHNFSLLIKLPALLCRCHCLVPQILFFFGCQNTDRFRSHNRENSVRFLIFPCGFNFINQTPASLLHLLFGIFRPVLFRIFLEWNQRFLSLLYKGIKQFQCFVSRRNLCNEFCFYPFRFRLTVHFHEISIDDFPCSFLLPRRFQFIPGLQHPPNQRVIDRFPDPLPVCLECHSPNHISILFTLFRDKDLTVLQVITSLLEFLHNTGYLLRYFRITAVNKRFLFRASRQTHDCHNYDYPEFNPCFVQFLFTPFHPRNLYLVKGHP